jgi:hypothetical protein
MSRVGWYAAYVYAAVLVAPVFLILLPIQIYDLIKAARDRRRWQRSTISLRDEKRAMHMAFIATAVHDLTTDELYDQCEQIYAAQPAETGWTL